MVIMATVAEKRQVKENKKGEGKQDNVMQYSRFMPRTSTETIALQRRHTLTQTRHRSSPHSSPYKGKSSCESLGSYGAKHVLDCTRSNPTAQRLPRERRTGSSSWTFNESLKKAKGLSEESALLWQREEKNTGLALSVFACLCLCTSTYTTRRLQRQTRSLTVKLHPKQTAHCLCFTLDFHYLEFLFSKRCSLSPLTCFIWRGAWECPLLKGGLFGCSRYNHVNILRWQLGANWLLALADLFPAPHTSTPAKFTLKQSF